MNDRNMPAASDPAAYAAVHTEIVTLLDSAPTVAAHSVNALMTASYWEIGRHIVEFEQGGHERAHYGQALIARLAADLSARFGRGFSKRNLEQMRLFYLAWPADEIAQTVSAQFTLPLIRQTLEDNSVSAKPPESDLEEALIQHLTDFLLELGDDFAFVGRQRRLRLDDSWFRIDLLFFHRSLKCLLVIDLKVGQFSYADAGQMHMYLNYARTHWMKPGENPPIGLILCAGKGSNEAHYTLEGLSNKVLTAEYRTALPDEKLLAEELEKTRQELEIRKIGQGGETENT